MNPLIKKNRFEHVIIAALCIVVVSCSPKKVREDEEEQVRVQALGFSQ